MMKVTLWLCALAIGAFSATNAFLNGLSSAPGILGYILGAALVGLLVWSGQSFALMSKAFVQRAWNRGFVLLAHWAISISLVLAMSISLVATHRSDVTATRQDQIDRYQRAEKNWNRINGEIQAADVKGRKTKDLRQDLKTVEAELQADRPAGSDVAAETLSWVFSLLGFHIATDSIGRAIPVLLAVGMDLAFGGCLMSIALVDTLEQRSPPVKKRKKRRTPPRRKAKILAFRRPRKKIPLSVVAS